MLKMRANKKLIQQHPYKESGKVVTLKDIHNLASTLASDNDLNMHTGRRKKKHEGICCYFCNVVKQHWAFIWNLL